MEKDRRPAAITWRARSNVRAFDGLVVELRKVLFERGWRGGARFVGPVGIEENQRDRKEGVMGIVTRE